MYKKQGSHKDRGLGYRGGVLGFPIEIAVANLVSSFAKVRNTEVHGRRSVPYTFYIRR